MRKASVSGTGTGRGLVIGVVELRDAVTGERRFPLVIKGGGKYGFPGGSIEVMHGRQEEPEQALIRELWEELGIKVTQENSKIAYLGKTTGWRRPHDVHVFHVQYWGALPDRPFRWTSEDPTHVLAHGEMSVKKMVPAHAWWLYETSRDICRAVFKPKHARAHAHAH